MNFARQFVIDKDSCKNYKIIVAKGVVKKFQVVKTDILLESDYSLFMSMVDLI